MGREPVPGIYTGRFYWQDGLKDVSVALDSDPSQRLNLRKREIREEIESMIKNAITQSNVRNAQGIFTISIVGFSPLLMSVKHFEIESPNLPQLLAYVKLEDINQIRRTIESNHNVNQRELLTQRTALYHAVAGSKIRAVKALLELGADPNIPDFEGDTPLITAVTVNSVEVARQLILSGADINKTNLKGTTPLIRAVELRRPSLLILLLQSGADPNRVSQDGETALRIALDKGNKAAIADLRRFGASR